MRYNRELMIAILHDRTPDRAQGQATAVRWNVSFV
jgi:hypothetical protein